MEKLLQLLQKSRVANAVAIGYVVFACTLVYLLHESVLAFLLFLGSLLVIYYANLNRWMKLVLSSVVVFVVMPSVGLQNEYYLDVATQVGIYMALALGLNVVVGFAGLLDLGYVAFYAVGAYVYAIFASNQAANFIPDTIAAFPLSGNWFWLFLPIGLILAAITGVILGLPALRLKGDYLAIVTLGFGEIIRILMNNADKPINITNGPQGITPIEPPALFGISLDQPMYLYFIVVGLVLFVLFVTRRLEHSRLGRAWAAIREDEIAAKAMGIPLVRTKLMAFALGASFAGAMGVLFAAKQTFIDPSSFTFMESIGVLAMVILGGMGSIPGALIGATAVTMLQLQLLKELSEYLGTLRDSGILYIPTQLEPAKYERLVFGLILIIMMIIRPQGMMPAKRRIVDTSQLADRRPEGNTLMVKHESL